MDYCRREYLENWTLTHPTRPLVEIWLWENGEDVTVAGGRGEAFSFGDAKAIVTGELIPSYEADGYEISQHDTDGGWTHG
jgi:hypothetical protein